MRAHAQNPRPQATSGKRHRAFLLRPPSPSLGDAFSMHALPSHTDEKPKADATMGRLEPRNEV